MIDLLIISLGLKLCFVIRYTVIDWVRGKTHCLSNVKRPNVTVGTHRKRILKLIFDVRLKTNFGRLNSD